MKKLNIVLAATGMTSLANDLYVTEVSKRLRQRGHKVWLVKANPEEQALEENDIPVYWPGPRWKWLWIPYVLCPYLKDRVISKIVVEGIKTIREKIDIVDFEATTPAAYYQRKETEAIVVRGWFYPHNFWKRIKIMWPVGPERISQKIIFMLRQIWFHWSEKCSYKKADSIITLTPQLAKQLKGLGFKATWIPLGIEVKEYRKQQIEKPVKLGTVVYDLENPRKGIKYMLKAIKTLEGMNLPYNSYRVELVGGYAEKLKEEIKKLGLEEKIKLLGRLGHPQVIARLQEWSLFVFPSLFEELSLASVEALGAGLAVIGWKIDALKAACGNTGILIPKGKVKLLAKTVAKLITNPKLRNEKGYQAWQRAKKYFDWEVVVRKLEKVYLEALKGT